MYSNISGGGALAIDIGSYQSRFGFTQDLHPKCILQSRVGVVDSRGTRKYFMDSQMSSGVPRMEIVAPVQKGIFIITQK